MITDHVWRRVLKLGGTPNSVLVATKACAYMNCGRPPAEHARVSGRTKVPQ